MKIKAIAADHDALKVMRSFQGKPDEETIHVLEALCSP
jgi:hypothetical protein